MHQGRQSQKTIGHSRRSGFHAWLGRPISDRAAQDVFFSSSLDGAPANWLKPTMIAEGLNPDEISAYTPGKRVENGAARLRHSKIKSAGHGVGMIKLVQSAVDICDQLIEEYDHAMSATSKQFVT